MQKLTLYPTRHACETMYQASIQLVAKVKCACGPGNEAVPELQLVMLNEFTGTITQQGRRVTYFIELSP